MELGHRNHEFIIDVFATWTLSESILKWLDCKQQCKHHIKQLNVWPGRIPLQFQSIKTSMHVKISHWKGNDLWSVHMDTLYLCLCFLNLGYSILQVFFLQGRFIFGPDVRSVFLTVILIVAPVAGFCVFVARKLMDDFPHDLGISIMVIVIALTLFVSSFLFQKPIFLSSSFILLLA